LKMKFSREGGEQDFRKALSSMLHFDGFLMESTESAGRDWLKAIISLMKIIVVGLFKSIINADSFVSGADEFKVA